MTSAGGGNLEVETTLGEAETIVRLVGELDCATVPRLQEALDRLGERRIRTLVFEMSGLEFIDSRGLHQLVMALERQREAGGAVVLRSPTPQTMRVLEIVGLSEVFEIA
jgi:anti-sigma B factor antagonist